MNIEQLSQQRKAYQVMKNSLISGKISHAYLFEGPSGTGKMAMALAFAKALFCKEPGYDACGRCLDCRKLENGNQPDVVTISPEGQSIKIDQIRHLQKELSYRNREERRKVYIMEQAEKMTPPAANSLLKFLEEPQSDIVAILVTTNGQAMLPTIKSRTQLVPFLPMDAEQMLKILVDEGHSELLSRAAVHLTAGLDEARAVVMQNQFAEIRSLVIQLGKESITRFTAAMITAQQQVFKTDMAAQAELLLSLLVVWFKDFVQYQVNRHEHIVFIDQIDWIRNYAFERSIAEWISCVEHVLQASKKIRAHVAPQLAFEQLFVKLQEG
ncbi:DNA polymerase III subunit delta' [Paenibacillus yanchengensis]|uniref:DNA polymerase III subunit delta n=1 Tax=Paenibacillus yanchengensis TaxID=2035833 RepID=A0ABW4YII1_9BACL